MSLSNLAHIKKKSLEKSQQVQKSGTKPKSKKSYLYVRLLFFFETCETFLFDYRICLLLLFPTDFIITFYFEQKYHTGKSQQIFPQLPINSS